MLPALGAETYDSGSAYLSQGQTMAYTINVGLYAQITMTPPTGADFDLYALKCGISSSGCACPTPSDVMQRAKFLSRYGVGREEVLKLPTGRWCIVVFAMSGSGVYSILGEFKSNKAPSASQPGDTVDPLTGFSTVKNPQTGKSDLEVAREIFSRTVIPPKNPDPVVSFKDFGPWG
jgi:hypothetical protein